jgi:Type II secretion system (T2SS), protein E, N-terminal domain
MAARLGDLLLQKQIITQDQLEQALAQQRRDGGRLGHILGQLGFVSEAAVAHALGQKYDLPYVDLDRHAIEPTVTRLIPRTWPGSTSSCPLPRSIVHSPWPSRTPPPS